MDPTWSMYVQVYLKRINLHPLLWSSHHLEKNVLYLWENLMAWLVMSELNNRWVSGLQCRVKIILRFDAGAVWSIPQLPVSLHKDVKHVEIPLKWKTLWDVNSLMKRRQLLVLLSVVSWLTLGSHVLGIVWNYWSFEGINVFALTWDGLIR